MDLAIIIEIPPSCVIVFFKQKWNISYGSTVGCKETFEKTGSIMFGDVSPT